MSLHTMSAASLSLGRAAAKVYSASSQGVNSYVLLFDSASTKLLATIEANQLGRLRTSASSAVAAEFLARKDASTLGIIGSGFQAEGVLRAYLDESFPISFERIIVFGRDEKRRRAFAEKSSTEFSRTIEPAASAEQLCRESDVLVTVTNSSQPIIEADWAKPGAHISALGSNALSRAELPARLITSANPLVVDSREAARAESGNLLAAIENGKLQWRGIPELGELLKADYPPTTSPTGISIFCSHGLAVQDLYTANIVYEAALQQA